MYKNIHTNEIKELVKVDIIETYPKAIKIYVFEDGEKWEESFFLGNWVEISN